MLNIEEKYIDAVTEKLYRLLRGEIPPILSLPNDFPDNEVRQMYNFFDKFLLEYQEFSNFLFSVASGELNSPPPMGKIKVMQAIKSLQSNLRHLTWKTIQIASGDFNQKVDFIGDFSKAFNQMTTQLKEAFEEIQFKNEMLLQQKEEISAQTENLRSAYDKLKELDEFKQGLTSMIVHDLKNPLNFILNIPNSYSQEKKIEMMQNAGRQMLNMVLNILDVQKFEEAKICLEKMNYSVNEIVKEAIFQIEFLAKQKNIEIKNEIFDNFVMKIDKELIIRVFANLFTNAIKYTHIGGSITLKAQETADHKLKISISDTGDGIPEDKLDKVFEKFEQIAAKASGNIRSTGLGLTFCKLAMESHNGNISVKSKLNEGTTFVLIFPKIEFFEKDKFSENRDIAESEKSIFSDFSDKERNLLKPYLTELQKFEVYETTEIENILEHIDFENSKNIEKWENNISETLYNLDFRKYSKLTNF